MTQRKGLMSKRCGCIMCYAQECCVRMCVFPSNHLPVIIFISSCPEILSRGWFENEPLVMETCFEAHTHAHAVFTSLWCVWPVFIVTSSCWSLCPAYNKWVSGHRSRPFLRPRLINGTHHRTQAPANAGTHMKTAHCPSSRHPGADLSRQTDREAGRRPRTDRLAASFLETNHVTLPFDLGGSRAESREKPV